MKRLVFLIMLIACSLGVYAQTEKGQSSVGFNVGYGFEYDNVTLGIDYRYNILDEFRLNPSITHFVKNNGVSSWAIDMNAHYLFKLSSMFGFYPLAGLNLSFWDLKHPHKEDYNRFGVNLGMGAELYATREVTVGVEFKYNIIKDFDQALFAVRAAYNF